MDIYLFSIYRDYSFRRLTVIYIDEYYYFTRDQIYEAATTYLGKKINDSPKPKRFTCTKAIKQNKPICDIAMEEEVIDNFGDIRLKWKSRVVKSEHPQQKPFYFF